MAKAESPMRSSGFMVPLRRGQSLVADVSISLVETCQEKEDSLFISFDMSHLSTVGAFALSAGGFPTAASFAGRIACRATECALLLFASKATFLVAVETAEFGFETAGKG